jgi:hypothetical protein
MMMRRRTMSIRFQTLLTYENMYDIQEASDDPDARN